MKILADIQAFQTDSRDRGIGRYVLGLVKALSERADVDVTGLLGAGNVRRLRDARNRLRSSRVCIHALACHYPFPLGDVIDLEPEIARAAGLLRSKFAAALKPDVMLIPSLFEGYYGGGATTTNLDPVSMGGIPRVAVAHDTIPLIFAEQYLACPRYRGWYERRLQVLLDCDLILTNSRSTAQDLVAYAGACPEKIRVIGAGLDESLVWSDEPDDEAGDKRRLECAGVSSAFVLVVGNGDWRKNNVGALDAFRLLPQQLVDSHELVFTQVGSDIQERLQQPEYNRISRKVVVLGNVSDALLRTLYRQCATLLFPSLYEGFGLPVLEAMANGAPVLTSNRGALAEVARAGATFDPEDTAALSRLLERAIGDDSFRSSLVDGAREHAAQFAWSRCAELAMESLIEMLANRAPPVEKRWSVEDAEIGVFADAVIAGGEEAEQQIRKGLMGVAARGRRRLLIDVTDVSKSAAWTGIQRVVRNYSVGLHSIGAGNGMEVVLFRWTENGLMHAREFARSLGIDQHGPDIALHIEPNDLVFMLDSTWESPERFDGLIESVAANGGELVWMVYDLVPINAPDTCHPGMPPAFSRWLSYATQHADGFVCISEATRMDLELYLDGQLKGHQRRPWTFSQHLGSDFESGTVAVMTDKGSSLLDALGAGPFALAIGTIEPRKDYTTILNGFEIAWAQGSPTALVIVGKAGWNVEDLVERIRQHPENGKRLYWLSGASDGDIRNLLASASVLVQASRLEGFGLPVVEAGSAGVPLLLSDIPVFREVAGDEASYFPTGDHQALGRHVLKHGAEGWKRPSQITTLTWSESSRRLFDILLPGSNRNLSQNHL